MKIETGKYYKHNKRKLYVKTTEEDWNGFVNIQYHDGRFGKLIPEAPGWEEITKSEWEVEKGKENEET